MKRVIASLIAAAGLAWSAPTAAQSRLEIETEEGGGLLELGVTAGYPTGFSGKYWMNSRQALGAGLAWNPDADGLAVNTDYLVHSDSLTREGAIILPVYSGIGARVVQYGDEDDLAVGPRVPIGITAIFEDLPVSVFAEVAPTVEFGRGDPDVVADATVGGRLLF